MPQWYGQAPPQYAAAPVVHLAPQQTVSVSRTGLPAWMHVVYAIGGMFTCGLLWIAWGFHAWYAVRATTTVAETRSVQYPGYPAPPPPQQPYGYAPPSPPQYRGPY